MPISTGRRLGSYEVVAPVVFSGMGEVYEARASALCSCKCGLAQPATPELTLQRLRNPKCAALKAGFKSYWRYV